MSFHQRTTEQSVEKSRQIEEKLQKTLDNIEIASNREDLVTDSIQFKQKLDIEVLKSRLEEMTEQYDREYENLDGQISYKSNAMDAMRDQYKDCLAKLEFYKSDIGRLRDWQEMWKLKKIDDANAELLKLSKQKKKKGSKKAKKKK
ncbi:uncharacterized protein LOC129906744 [Episyrphus balteatus]|uniref:uncharacterized protein LOC129906744 n=1 Tax=Episyrphus balteatus TaxID=286459 RepID=UPI002486679D|nr:uncharacterized protein LOC129906744 [Episyrphus balteatus]